MSEPLPAGATADTSDHLLAEYAEVERAVYELAGLRGTAEGAMPVAERVLELVRAYAEHARLGLATTGNLLAEVTVRIETDYRRGGGGLGYSTVHGRPELPGPSRKWPPSVSVHQAQVRQAGGERWATRPYDRQEAHLVADLPTGTLLAAECGADSVSWATVDPTTMAGRLCAECLEARRPE